MKTIVLYAVDSTNTFLKEYIRQRDVSLPMCVAALRQTAGKGRYTREWSSPPGGLYMSIAENLTHKNIPAIAYPLCMAVAVHRWLKKTYKISDMFIKWPNDVYINMKKICGILSTVQTCGERSVIITGIGINVRNEVPDNGTSLVLLLPERSFNLHTMLQALVREIENTDDTMESVRAYITNYLWGKDQIRKLTIHGQETRGIIRGIADDFSLLLEDEHTGTITKHSLGEME